MSKKTYKKIEEKSEEKRCTPTNRQCCLCSDARVLSRAWGDNVAIASSDT
jgi:hypothetical protein